MGRNTGCRLCRNPTLSPPIPFTSAPPVLWRIKQIPSFPRIRLTTLSFDMREEVKFEYVEKSTGFEGGNDV